MEILNGSIPLLTVFTPAYNRAHTLHRTYQSLVNQDCKDFLWLIIDDGSSDNTRELVKRWQQIQNGFEIRYIYKENGGMHTAHNVAYENINTELNVCIDSDDMLAPGAVRKISEIWKKENNKKFAGIIGLDAYMDTGEVIGTGFPDGVKYSTLQAFYDAGGTGDKKLVYRTDIMKELPPYPVFGNEKYVALGWKYLLCDLKYQMIVANEVFCNVEYQPDGSSNNMLKQYVNNPNGFAFVRKEYMKYLTKKDRIVKDCIHYCSSSLLIGNKNYIKESPRRFLTILCTPAGWLLSKYIRYKTR